MSIDLLVVGAHPDDAELGAGGTLALFAKRGLKTAILDLTRGESGSRGTSEERAAEANAAAEVLGVSDRRNLRLPDGKIVDSPLYRQGIIWHIRCLKPRVLIIPASPDRHPDHAAAHDLALNANFLAGLKNYSIDKNVTRMPPSIVSETVELFGNLGFAQEQQDALLRALPQEDAECPPHRAETVLFYHPYADQETMPTFVQDISETFETKLAALRCYKSQFHNPEYAGVDTFVSSPAFWEGITARAAYWGGRIGVKYGEPFYARGPLALDVASTWLGEKL